jgi:hypothetical protein
MEGLSVLEEFVSQHRDAILGDWFECILAGYPKETGKFLREKKDPFGNPVGTGLREELGTLLDAALSTVDDEQLTAALDRIIRVRAVQDFEPSRAVGFLFELKAVIRRWTDRQGFEDGRELEEFDLQVDRLVLAAFDVYNVCREQLHEIRVRSIRKLSLDRIEQLNDWRAGRSGDGASDGEIS